MVTYSLIVTYTSGAIARIPLGYAGEALKEMSERFADDAGCGNVAKWEIYPNHEAVTTDELLALLEPTC